MDLKTLRRLSRKELTNRVDGRFKAAEEADSLEWRSLHFTEADLYLWEVSRRREKWNVIMEIAIVALITAEFALALGALNLQNKSTYHEEAAFNGLQQSLNVTAKNLEALNQKIQLELDLYYEPSVLLVYRREGTVELAEVENRGRTSIRILGVKAVPRNSPKFSRLKEPLTISAGSHNALSAEFVSRLIQDVIVSGGWAPITIYFKTENGRVWEHRANVNRCPLADGKCVIFENQRSELLAPTDELAWEFGKTNGNLIRR